MTVRDDAVDTDREPGGADRHERGRGRARAASSARSAAAWLVATIVVFGGMGWLYLLRDATTLRVGPQLADALPLEQLAAHSSQPLLVVAVAFVPSGAVASLALAYVGRVRPLVRVVALGVWTAVLLLADAVLSGAVAQNERVTKHLVPTLGHSGIWVEVACVVIGSSLAVLAARRSRPGAGGAASAA